MTVVNMLLVCLCFLSVHLGLGQDCEKTRFGSVNTEADVQLGATFNVHRGGSAGCSDVINPDGILRQEAAHFAVKKLNAEKFLPGVTFGIRTYDDCGTPNVGVKRLVNFLAEREKFTDESGDICPANVSYPGLIGSLHSDVTQEMASFLTSVKKPLVSYGSHSNALGDKELYPLFQRTASNVSSYVKVVMSILRKLGWTHVSILVGSDPYSKGVKEEILRQADPSDANICVMKIKSVADKDPKPDYLSIVKDFTEASKKGAPGVIVVATPKVVRDFFTAVDAAIPIVPEAADLQWVMALPFFYDETYQYLSNVIKGLIFPKTYSPTIDEFKKYFVSLTPENNDDNPFFSKYYAQQYKCSHYTYCDTLKPQIGADDFVAETIAAVYTYAHGLRNAHKDLCTGPGLCHALVNLPASDFMVYLRAVEFTQLDGRIMAFTETGEASFPMYSVYNIQLTGKSLDIKEVGTWKSGNLEIISPIKMYDRKGKETAKHIPSTCTENCHECLHTVDRISEIPGGDVQLLGVFNAHSKGSNGRECSKSVDEIGVLAEVEGFLYAVDQINNDPTILPDVKLGATVLDDCAFSPVRTFRQISRFLVKNDESAGKNGFAPVLGSVTALSSNAAIYTQDILEVYGVPQISYRSSSPLLSDKKKYPNFLRVIGSDQYQVEAFIDILKASKWTSVIAIYSDNAYGLEGSRLLLKLAQEEGITVSTLVKMNDDIASDSNAIRDIIRYISSGFRAQVQVVIMFTTAEHTRAILAGKDREKDLPRKTWFGGDGWGTELGIVSGLEETAEGAVTLDFFSAPVDGFNKYLTTLSPFKNSRNVWFREFWEQKFECFIADRTFKEPCQDDRLTPEDIAPFQGRVAFITDIVRLYAKGLEQLMADFCPMTPSKLCVNAVKNLNKVTTYIKDSEFTGSSGLEVAFDSFDDAIPSYQINTFQELSRNKYGYINVGQWVNGNLLLEHISADTIVSSCSKPPCRTTSPDVLDLQFHPQPQDFTLIGLFPLYGFDTCGNTCDGELRHEIYHSLLGFYYAIDQINKKAAIILQGSKLGYVVYNTCSSPTVASDVVNGFDAKYPYFSQPPEVPVRTGVLGMVAGFEKNESDAISEARREQQHLVQISPVKEGSKTDGVIGVPHVVKDTTTLLVNVLFRLQWTHVSIVASNEKASLDLALILKNDIERRTFIIGTFLTVNGTSASDYDDVIAKLVKAGAPNVVTFANADDSRQLLLAAERQDTAGRLLWINAGQWKYPKMVVDGLDEVMKGSLILVPDAVLDADFDSFTKTLTPDSFPDDPWYAEFWEKHFQCALTFGGKFPNACTGDESFERRPLPPMPVTANTAKAVYAYADGLAKFYLYKCGRVDFEGCLGQVNGDAKDVAELYKEVRLVLDEGVDDPVLNFRYEYKILNFQKLKDGSFGYATVGSWYKGKLSLSPSDVQRYDSLEKGALLPPPPPLPARSPNLRGYYKHFLNR